LALTFQSSRVAARAYVHHEHAHMRSTFFNSSRIIQIHTCTHTHTHHAHAGGFPTGAWHFFKSHGLVTEDRYPYAFPPCEHHINSTHYQPCGASKPTPKCVRTQETKPRYHGKSVYSVPTKSIMEEIQTNGPVEGAFTVFKDFLTYKSGVYQVCELCVYVYMQQVCLFTDFLSFDCVRICVSKINMCVSR
jgi:hypothetical protein